MSGDQGGGRDESGARTVGTGVFLLLAGLSVALMAVSLPLGAAALAVSAGAGFVAARRRTAEAGLPGGPVDPTERLEGFVIDPLADGDGAATEWVSSFAGGDEPDEPAPRWLRDDAAPVAEVPHLDEVHEVPAHEEVAEGAAAEAAEPAPAWLLDEPFADRIDEPAPFEPTPFADHRLDEPAAFEPAPFEAAPFEAPVGSSLPEELLPDPEQVARDERAGHLRAVHAAAVEELNVAIARWHQLVGDDADPFDPEPVIRAHDPQLAFDPAHVEASPTVRTVASYHRRTQARWRVLWASLGLDEVPDPADVDHVLATLLADHHAAIAERERLEAAEARARAREVLARPLVLAEPEAWIAAGRLDQLLSSLPDETEVVVVERAAS